MRARNIKPDFFRDYDLCQLDVWARLLFAGLWCMADREGRLEYCPPRIAADVFPYDKIEVEKLLEQLATHNFVVIYEVVATDSGVVATSRRYVQVLNFDKHQNPHKNEKPSNIPPLEEGRVISGNAQVITGANRADSLIPDSLIPDSSDNSGEKSAPPWREKFAPEVVEFVEQFQGYVAQTQGAKAPKVNDTLLKTCADTVEKLTRIDKHSLTTVVDVMRWAVADEFWSSNVLSLASLRKKKEAGGQTKFQKILAAYERTSVTSSDVLNEMVRRVEGGKRNETEGVCADIKTIAPHSGTGPTRYSGTEADPGDSGAMAGGCGAQAGGDLDRW